MAKSTPNILSNIAQRGLIKEYATFLKVKSLHKNSVIYKPKKLHLKLNCSLTKSNRIIRIIINEGWGYYSKGHLVLNSAATIHYNLTEYKPKTFVKVFSIEDIYTELLKNKIRQQTFINNIKSDLESKSSKAAKKAITFLRGEKGFINDEQLINKTGTGLQTLSKVLGYSEGHTGHIIRYLSSCGLLEITRRKPVLIDYAPFIKLSYLPSGCFLKNNCFVYQRLSNKIKVDDL